MSNRKVQQQIQAAGAHANKFVQALPDVMFGEESPEFRLDRLQREGQEAIASAVAELQKLSDQASENKKVREAILKAGIADLERDLTKQGKLEKGKHIRLGAEDKHVILSASNYYNDLDATFLLMESLITPLRALKNFEKSFEIETKELAHEWGRNKMQSLLAVQQQPAIDMAFTDLEALVTCPIEKKRAKRAMALQENAANGEPVSAERKAKLLPKPKAKGRGGKKKNNQDPPAAVPTQAPKRVRVESEPVVEEAEEGEVELPIEEEQEEPGEEFNLWS